MPRLGHPLFLLCSCKRKGCGMLVLLAGTQDRRWKVRMMNGVRIILRLQTVTVSRTICTTVFSRMIFAYIVRGVEMNTGHRGFQAHCNTRCIRSCYGGRPQLSNISVDHIVVVIALCLLNLRKRIFHMGLDRQQFSQVHGALFHSSKTAIRDTFRIAGCVIVGE